MHPVLSDAELVHRLRLVEKHGNIAKAARELDISRSAFSTSVLLAKKRGLTASTKLQRTEDVLRTRLQAAQLELASIRRDNVSAEILRYQLYQLAEMTPDPPAWITNKSRVGTPGVPMTMWSDWHWGEVVRSQEVGGVNTFNRAVAKQRLKQLVNTTVDLVKNHMVKPTYPGIVICLGGDMISGNIHEELRETNEGHVQQSLLEVQEQLESALAFMADQFGRVFVPCVVGNHGRMTHKPRAKGRVYESYEWNLYCQLERHFRHDKRIQFLIPSETDAHFTVLGHRFLLTHGDALGVKGGDGIIGAIGPITRGAIKVGRSESQIGRDFDTLLMGHWHTYIPRGDASAVVVNGCFPAGSLVSTDVGSKPIEEVEIGDRVLSRDGSIQRVSHRFEKCSDHGLVHLKVRGLNVPLSATPNHLIWAVKAETKSCGSIGKKWDVLTGGGDEPHWIPADYLSPGDYVHIPRHNGTYAGIDEETAWAWGLYIAEGSTILDGGKAKNHNRICLTMHGRELPILQRWAKWFDGTYGGKCRVHHRKRPGTTSELVVSPGRKVCAEFREMFGHKSSGKHVPPVALELTPKLASALLRGWYDGDGHTSKAGVTSATTISKQLAHQMFSVALSAGLKPSLAMIAKGGPRKNDSYVLHLNNGQESLEIGGELFYRIHARYRDRKIVPVYDLEVSGEHTYVVNSVGVHNSLKGYDEYARLFLRVPYSRPSQALWFVNERYGITAQWQIYLDRLRTSSSSAKWVSWETRIAA